MWRHDHGEPVGVEVRMELQEKIPIKIKIYHTNASISVSVAQHNTGAPNVKFRKLSVRKTI